MAINNRTWGQCGKSGQRMLLKDMMEDGYNPGMLVHPDWYEPPKTEGERPNIFDRQTVDRPAPQNNQMNHTVGWPLFDFDTFEAVPPIIAYLEMGTVTPFILSTPVGISLALALGTMEPVTINDAMGYGISLEMGTVSPFSGIIATPLGVAITTALGTVRPVIFAVPSGVSMGLSLGTVSIAIDETFWGSGSWGSGSWGL